jgi:copper transport protein
MTRCAAARAVRRRPLIAGFAIALLLAVPSRAGAHAALVNATPGSGVVLRSGPRELKLVFDEDVVPRYARVAVVGAHGQDLAGLPTVDGSVVAIPVRPAPVGSYTVRWRMVAENDGHATEGAYSFGVRVKPLPPAPVSGIGIPVAPELLAWLEFVGVVLAGGVLTFRAIVRPRGPPGGEQTTRDGTVSMWLGVVGAVIALHAGVLAFLTGAYPITGGGLSGFVNTEIVPIRVGTHLGQAWTVTTFAWLGVLALLIAAWVTPRRREALLASAGLSALGIAFGISWASHPASRGVLALLADYLHLLAAALWVGGLLSLVILAVAARPLSQPAREAMLRSTVLGLSRIAVSFVALVGLAGIYLAIRELPTPSALLTSSYGVWLLVKTAVVVGALALGGYHRRFVVPQIASGAPVATIRRTLALEVSLLAVALVLAAILSQTAPPK